MRYIGLEKKRASRERGRYNYRVPGNYSSVTRVGAAAGVGMCRERERERARRERGRSGISVFCVSLRARMAYERGFIIRGILLDRYISCAERGGKKESNVLT